MLRCFDALLPLQQQASSPASALNSFTPTCTTHSLIRHAQPRQATTHGATHAAVACAGGGAVVVVAVSSLDLSLLIKPSLLLLLLNRQAGARPSTLPPPNPMASRRPPPPGTTPVQADNKKRLEDLLKRPDNQVCADCPERGTSSLVIYFALRFSLHGRVHGCIACGERRRGVDACDCAPEKMRRVRPHITNPMHLPLTPPSLPPILPPSFTQAPAGPRPRWAPSSASSAVASTATWACTFPLFGPSTWTSGRRSMSR